MTTKKNLVNLVLMSIVTVATSFNFTACSDTFESDQLANDGSKENVTRGELLDPIALIYTDFISSSDVQIMTADTTKISISKALADKLDITSFVDHPMGIQEGEHIRPYHIRATKEILQGDRYILDVVQASIGEFIADPIALSTDFYKNDGSATRSASGDAYTDAEGVIHPQGVYVIDVPADAPEFATRSLDEFPMTYFSAEEVLGLTTTRGIKNGTYFKIDKAGNVINMKSELKKDIQFGSDEDTIMVHVKTPVTFDLNYKLYINCGRKKYVVPYIKGFDANINGSFSFKPEVTIGFDKKVKIAEKKVKIGDFKGFSFKFTIAGVPFWVDIKPKMYVKFEAEVEGKFYGGFKYEYEKNFKAGLKKDTGWTAYGDSEVQKNEFTFIIGVDILIDKCAGPELAIGPKVKAEAEMTFAPFDKQKPLSFEASLKAGVYADLGVQLKFWKFDIAEWKTTFNMVPEQKLWSYEYPQDMYSKKNDPVTKVLDEATKVIQEAQL